MQFDFSLRSQIPQSLRAARSASAIAVFGVQIIARVWVSMRAIRFGALDFRAVATEDILRLSVGLDMLRVGAHTVVDTASMFANESLWERSDEQRINQMRSQRTLPAVDSYDREGPITTVKAASCPQPARLRELDTTPESFLAGQGPGSIAVHQE